MVVVLVAVVVGFVPVRITVVVVMAFPVGGIAIALAVGVAIGVAVVGVAAAIVSITHANIFQCLLSNKTGQTSVASSDLHRRFASPKINLTLFV